MSVMNTLTRMLENVHARDQLMSYNKHVNNNVKTTFTQTKYCIGFVLVTFVWHLIQRLLLKIKQLLITKVQTIYIVRCSICGENIL